MYSSPFLTARVFIPLTSDPQPGSVTPYAYMRRQLHHLQSRLYIEILQQYHLPYTIPFVMRVQQLKGISLNSIYCTKADLCLCVIIWLPLESQTRTSARISPNQHHYLSHPVSPGAHGRLTSHTQYHREHTAD